MRKNIGIDSVIGESRAHIHLSASLKSVSNAMFFSFIHVIVCLFFRFGIILRCKIMKEYLHLTQMHMHYRNVIICPAGKIHKINNFNENDAILVLCISFSMNQMSTNEFTRIEHNAYYEFMLI